MIYKQILKEIHSFAPSFNLRRANQRRTNLRRASGDPYILYITGGTGRTGMVIAAVVKNFGIYDPVSRIRRVKSTYVETFEQEKFLKNMPKAIDSRIIKDSPLLAMAIAAEHLIQVFHTHGDKLDQSEMAQKGDS